MEEEILLEEEITIEPPRLVGNFYLRFSDYNSFFNAADEAGFVREDVTEWETITVTETIETPEGEEEIQKEVQEPKTTEKNLISSSFGHQFEVIGTITKVLASQDDSLEEEPETVTLEGFHVNYSGILPVQFESAWIDIPNNPHRKLNWPTPLTTEEADPII